MTGKRIDWTEHELDKLYDAAKAAWAGPLKGASIVNVVKAAQLTLDEPRRRMLVAIDNIPTPLRIRLVTEGIGVVSTRYKGKIEGKEKTKDEIRIDQLADELEQKNQEIMDLQAELKEVRVQLFTERNKPKPKPELEIVQDFLAGILYKAKVWEKAIVKPVTEGEAPPLNAPPPAGGNGVAKHNPEPKQEERVRLPRVLIVGLKQNQRAYIESELDGKVQPRFFWEPYGQSNSHLLKDKARGVDMVYCLMDACSHAAVTACTDVNKNVQRVATRNQETLRDMILAFAAKLQREQPNTLRGGSDAVR